MSHLPSPPYPFRQLRLSHGWDPDQLALRMKFIAHRHGHTLPKVGDLVTWFFLWENHREQVPGVYAELLSATFDAYAGRKVTL